MTMQKLNGATCYNAGCGNFFHAGGIWGGENGSGSGLSNADQTKNTRKLDTAPPIWHPEWSNGGGEGF